MTSNFIFF